MPAPRDTGRPLTGPQLELLRRSVRDGRVLLNGRARMTVDRLEARGLVTADWTPVAGSRSAFGVAEFQSWRADVRPTLEGIALVAATGGPQ